MINLKDIIYFTKEDGQNKLLSTSPAGSIEMMDYISDALMSYYTKRLGHKPTNIYALVEGTELKVWG